MTDEEAEAILMNEPVITEDYVTSDGRTIPAVYIALRNRLLRVGQGVGCEIHDNAWDFLMQEFTEDEAAFYLKLPNFAYFTDKEAGEAEGQWRNGRLQGRRGEGERSGGSAERDDALQGVFPALQPMGDCEIEQG